MSIGPSGIYNYAADEQPTPPFCCSDSEEALQIYKKDFQPGGKGEFFSGDSMCCNILMVGARFANLGLIAHIVANADPKLLNMRDGMGKTALHHLIERTVRFLSTGKALACAQILIQGGADINARHTYKYQPVLRPVPEWTLKEDNFIGENALGYLVRELCDASTSTENKKKCEIVMQLFLMHGATQCYTVINHCMFGYNVKDPVNKEDTSEKASHIRTLKRLEANNLDWVKTRLLILGQRDVRSSLSGLPFDLIKLIHQKKLLMAFESEVSRPINLIHHEF